MLRKFSCHHIVAGSYLGTLKENCGRNPAKFTRYWITKKHNIEKRSGRKVALSTSLKIHPVHAWSCAIVIFLFHTKPSEDNRSYLDIFRALPSIVRTLPKIPKNAYDHAKLARDFRTLLEVLRIFRKCVINTCNHFSL